MKKILAVFIFVMLSVTLSTACSIDMGSGFTSETILPGTESTDATTSETSRNTIVINPTAQAPSATATTPTTESATTAVIDETASAAEKRIKDIIAGMTLEEKVGQMFIARCPEEDATGKAAEYQLGGYILFGRDFKGKTKEQVIKNISDIQAAAKLPMLIGVDEEGGTVNRVSSYKAFRSEPFKSPRKLYSSYGGFEAIKSDTIEKAKLLKSLGINLNFAPVCDVSTDKNDFIYERAFGISAGMTAQYVELVVRTMATQQMGSVLKHFPGYGNNADTHTGVAYDNRPYETFINEDFLPFKAGIDAGANVVLVSHNVVNCIDSTLPASLSGKVHEILRNDLGFSKVIVTDDLAMEGVRSFASDSAVAVLAVKVGNDLLCCTNFEEQVPAVIDAVRSGEISEAQIEESVYRILSMKLSLGIME